MPRINVARTLEWKESPVWLRALWIAALGNFFAFWVVAVFCGGDALNGKVTAERFFVGSHGRYTEVSAGFFRYSQLHGISAMTLLPIAVFAVAWFSWKQKRD